MESINRILGIIYNNEYKKKITMLIKFAKRIFYERRNIYEQ